MHFIMRHLVFFFELIIPSPVTPPVPGNAMLFLDGTPMLFLDGTNMEYLS